MEAGRAVRDCHLDEKKTYLIEKLKYRFTLMISRNILTIKDKATLKAHNIAVIEINDRKNTDLMWTYKLGLNTAYLFTPDQYILGRWKDFIPKKAIDLMQTYLSGATYEMDTLHKTEQEIIDEQVAEKLMRLAN